MTCRQFPNLTFAPRKTCHSQAATSRFSAINVTTVVIIQECSGICKDFLEKSSEKVFTKCTKFWVKFWWFCRYETARLCGVYRAGAEHKILWKAPFSDLCTQIIQLVRTDILAMGPHDRKAVCLYLTEIIRLSQLPIPFIPLPPFHYTSCYR